MAELALPWRGGIVPIAISKAKALRNCVVRRGDRNSNGTVAFHGGNGVGKRNFHLKNEGILGISRFKLKTLNPSAPFPHFSLFLTRSRPLSLSLTLLSASSSRQRRWLTTAAAAAAHESSANLSLSLLSSLALSTVFCFVPATLLLAVAAAHNSGGGGNGSPAAARNRIKKPLLMIDLRYYHRGTIHFPNV